MLFDPVDPSSLPMPVAYLPARADRKEKRTSVTQPMGDAPKARLEQDDMEVLAMPKAEVPAASTKGWGQTLKENFQTGIETAGAGLSAGIGRDASVVASDLADMGQFKQSQEEIDYQKGLKESIDSFDKDASFGSAMTILGHMAKNPKQTFGDVAKSLGMSLPAYGGAAAGAAGGAALGSVVPGAGTAAGAVVGGVVGYLFGNLATNVQGEIAGSLQESLAKKGVDTTNARDVQMALTKEPALLTEAKQRGVIRGSATTAAESVVDVATLGAGKLLKPATSVLGKLGKGGGAMLGQGVGEAAGNIAADASTGDPISFGAALHEGALGAVSGAPEGIGALRAGQALQKKPEDSSIPADGISTDPANPASWEVIGNERMANRQLGYDSPDRIAYDNLARLGYQKQEQPLAEREKVHPAVWELVGDDLANSDGFKALTQPLWDTKALPAPGGPTDGGGGANIAERERAQPADWELVGDPLAVREGDLQLTQPRWNTKALPNDVTRDNGKPFLLKSSAQKEADKIGGVVVPLGLGFVVRKVDGTAGTAGTDAADQSATDATPASDAGQPGSGIAESVASDRSGAADGVRPNQGPSKLTLVNQYGQMLAQTSANADPLDTLDDAKRLQAQTDLNDWMDVADDILARRGVTPPERERANASTTNPASAERGGMADGLDAADGAQAEQGAQASSQSAGAENAAVQASRDATAAEDLAVDPKEAAKAERAQAQSERAQKRMAGQRVINREKDSLMTAVAKLGGIDKKQVLKEFGFDPKDIAKAQSGIFGKPVFRASGGKSVDEIRQALIESGYLNPDNLNELETKLSDGLFGNHHYTAEGMIAQAEAARAEEDAAAALAEVDDATLNRLLREAEDNEITDAQLDAIEEEARAIEDDESTSAIAAREAAADGAGRSEEAFLTQPTKDGLLAKAEQALQAEKQKKAKDAAPPPEEFTLTGSNSNADRAIAAGQRELAPAKQEAGAKSEPASKEVIEVKDFDRRGELNKTKMAPKDEVLRDLRIQEGLLKRLVACVK